MSKAKTTVTINISGMLESFQKTALKSSIEGSKLGPELIIEELIELLSTGDVTLKEMIASGPDMKYKIGLTVK